MVSVKIYILAATLAYFATGGRWTISLLGLIICLFVPDIDRESPKSVHKGPNGNCQGHKHSPLGSCNQDEIDFTNFVTEPTTDVEINVSDAKTETLPNGAVRLKRSTNGTNKLGNTLVFKRTESPSS
ncbi:hypothetical protein CANARDRAFT_29734 [[Candida] arabinofermentans NRRL YB-2248]|uniref:Uncharacterized protein n=1 Tax=[Candida] arabinofermentans NRRL YB-2248 TaxID=983967 RepID=A0A1E4SW66_9ASCO|nr:hypothetical protein CANARDRAFT_29734 [[Candida] arabinofermentans NRRL YB-2248]